ncbi:MAG: transglutaminase domain-containing protein [Ignavibacteriales bacterium]|nr:transglutaminase domain-containing protein [Ignavibacteriales bacterium]
MLFTGISLQAQQAALDNLDAVIEQGNFKLAEHLIDSLKTVKGIPKAIKSEIAFRKDRMERILKEYTKTEASVLEYIQKYIPEATSKDLRGWESKKQLEMKVINGERKYFDNAARNLFRLDPAAKERMEKVNGKPQDKLSDFLSVELPAIVDSFQKQGAKLLNPVTIDLNYTLTVPMANVKDASVIRVWLPFPRAGHARQIYIENKSSNNGKLAPAKALHSTLYLEGVPTKDSAAIFSMASRYRAYAEYNNINFDTVTFSKVRKKLQKYVREELPHIRFTNELKSLSEKIVGTEKHKGKIAKLIFQWISDNIPWASAREYSTIPNISTYCINEGHGDCGIQSLLFITLCRYNGIPAKWQSGWMLHSGSLNLHDWSEVFVEGKGWVPVDQSFGLQPSDNEKVKWFYLGNTDAYHLIVNDAISAPFTPKKKFPRSETVDFQRGEVETNKANLYFDEWDYHMEVKYNK